MPVTVSIVEDDQDTRASLARLIRNTPGLKCLDTYATAEAALENIPVRTPDILMVDIRLPGISGIECVARLTVQLPQLQVLMLTTYGERELIFNSLRAGASGYILKNASHTELVQAIEQLHRGGAPMSISIARQLVGYFQRAPKDTEDMHKLSEREQEILRLLARGDQYKQIADYLGISIDTVRYHIKHIYEKLHVRTRHEATAKFLESPTSR